MTDRVAEQRAKGDVTERDQNINKTGIKQGHLQHLQVSKEMPTRPHCGEITNKTSMPLCFQARKGPPLDINILVTDLHHPLARVDISDTAMHCNDVHKLFFIRLYFQLLWCCDKLW